MTSLLKVLLCLGMPVFACYMGATSRDTTKPQQRATSPDGSVWIDNYDTVHYNVHSIAPIVILVSDTNTHGVEAEMRGTYHINGWLQRATPPGPGSSQQQKEDIVLGLDYKPLKTNLVVWMYRNRKL